MSNLDGKPLCETFKPRELEILQLIAEGWSNHEIAEELIIAVPTVRWYNRQIYHKLGVHSRTLAIARAREIGLLNGHSAAVDVAPAVAVPALCLPSHNLPASVTSFIGRHEEVTAVCQRLMRDDVRLLTLTGAGGTGKTRLALQASTELLDHFQDGVYFVPLGDINDPNLVIPAVAQQLEVHSDSGQSLLENLKEYMSDRQILLLLDNFEHVAGAAPEVADLLSAAPALKVLATSRALLNLQGEHELPVQPLRVPVLDSKFPLEHLSQYEAVRLFIERAQVADAHFSITNENAPAVAEICYRLDGLPLAIELAAARVKLLSPQKLLARLGSRLDLLTGGARDLPDRQQTLRNTVDWSYDLLNHEAQVLFARLAVFAGGFTLEAAEAICAVENDLDILEGVSALMSNSLLQHSEKTNGEVRFRMLETIREYALERLEEGGELEIIQRQHSHFFLELAQRAQTKLFTAESKAWLECLTEEYDNLRAVLAWSHTAPDGPEIAAHLISALERFWYLRALFHEGSIWCERVLSLTAGMEYEAARAQVLVISAEIMMLRCDFDTACSLAEESVSLWRSLNKSVNLAGALTLNGILLVYQGNEVAARPLLEESLAIGRKQGAHLFDARMLRYLGMAGIVLEDYASARRFLNDSVSAAQAAEDKCNLALTLYQLGDLARIGGDYQQARPYYEESRMLSTGLDNRIDIAKALYGLACVAYRLGDSNQALALFHESLSMLRELGSEGKFGVAECLMGLAGLAVEQGQPQYAVQLLGAAWAIMRTFHGNWWPPDRIDYDRCLAAVRDALDEASFAEAWAQGQKITLSQATGFALEMA